MSVAVEPVRLNGPYPAAAEVVLLEADPIARSVLTRVLEREGRLRVVVPPPSAVAGGRAGLAEALSRRVGTLVLTLRSHEELPEWVGELTANYGTRVVLLRCAWTARQLEAARAAGVGGCLVKDAETAGLAEAVAAVRAGLSVVSPQLQRPAVPTAAAPAADAGADAGRLEALTDREREVLRLLAEGLSGAEAARRLHVSPTTVKSHVSHALAKLGARNRVQAVLLVRAALDTGGTAGAGAAR